MIDQHLLTTIRTMITHPEFDSAIMSDSEHDLLAVINDCITESMTDSMFDTLLDLANTMKQL